MSRWPRLAALALLALPEIAGAQVRPSLPRPTPGQPGQQRPMPGQRQVPGQPRDTLPADSTAQWTPPDSTMRALLEKPGYTVTRYEGQTVAFDAVTKALQIAASEAKRAMVERDSMRANTDATILYEDRTSRVNVSSKPRGRFEIVLGSGQAPIQGSGTAQYDLARRSGRLTNATTTVDESGERWYIKSEVSIPVLGDSARGIAPRFYGVGGSLTSCDDSIPDYHFRLREIKRTKNTLVARPAVLFLEDIPVMWLPFVFQDIRPGRRSGILPPSFGASDIIRNNPRYRRHVENIGYYWAISDYVDFATWLNWRSSAGADSTDPGWYELNAQWSYNWLTRFLTGQIAAAFMKERTGSEKLSVYWRHQQRLGTNRNFSSNLNYTSSTTLQRRNTFVPASAIATVVSTLAFSDKYGPASIQIGGTQRQFPGRRQVERQAPSITVSSTPMALGEWLLWTPSFSFNESASLHIDQVGQFSTRVVADSNGQAIGVDSLNRNRYSRTMTLGSPLRLFGLDLSQNVTIRDELYDYPAELTVYPNADSSLKALRVFPQVYTTTVDWNPTFSLPPIFQNRFKITPSVTLSNVDPRPFWVRSVTSNGRFVHQSKRLSYGLTAAPTIFGIWPGFGPFQRFRHSISPTISYSYAPSARVSREYLEALNDQEDTYLGSLQQNAISLGLSQNIEAKVRTPGDTSSENMQKLKILTLNFTPLSYDFERARKTGRSLSGFTTETFGGSLRSDLLPGFDISAQYSLFQGSTLSDTAEFMPFLTNVSSSFRISQNENPLTVITRLFGRAIPERSPPQTTGMPRDEATFTREIVSQPVAGSAARTREFVVPPTQGWQASINFSTSRFRPPRGDRIVQFDPKDRCEPLKNLNVFLYDECLRSPALDEPIVPPLAGGPGIHTPRQTSMTGDLRFALTQKWAAAWSTSYDFESSQFASQVVSLQRDLHDWRAIFAFTHSPNGNFAFNFFIALKPQPELKFDYSRATVRSQ